LRDNLARRATAIEPVLGKRPSWEELTAALLAGWQESLGIRLVAGRLSAEEESAAQRLHDEKYATDGWNAKRPGLPA
jgi:lipoate-protein ligase A